jgi:hypothetical protein
MERLKDEELYEIDGGSFADFLVGLGYGLVILCGM